MNLDQIATKCFILALFIRDDGQRLLLGDGYYDFNQKLQHFQANTIANDVVEIQGDSGQLLAGQVMRSGAQKFEGYIGDATTNRQTIEQKRSDFMAFFRIKHFYKVIYIFPDGTAIQRQRGYLTDAPTIPEIFQKFPEYSVALNFEDANYYEYAEDDHGDEIYAHIAELALAGEAIGGLIWDEIGAVTNGITWSGIQTAQGEYIQITNDLDIPAKLSNVEMLGNAEQTTYSGKNKVHLPSGTYTSNGITWTVTDETIKANGTATSNWSIPMGFITFPRPLPAGTYTFSIPSAINKTLQFNLRDESEAMHDYNINAQSNSVTFTISFVAISFRFALRAETGTTTNFTIPNQLQLEAGSSKTDFEPYVGGTPAPNPDYPQPISVVTGENVVKIEGKNLFDNARKSGTTTMWGLNIEVLDYSSIRVNGTVSGTCWCELMMPIYFLRPIGNTTTKLFGLDPTKEYTLSAKVVSGTWTPANTGSNLYIQTSANNAQQDTILNGTPSTFTGADGIYRGWMRFLQGDVFNDAVLTFQLELGSTATAYEPYQGQEFEVNLGKNLFDLKGFLDSKSVTYTEASDGTITFTSVGELYSEPFQFSQNDTTVSIQGIISNLTGTNFRIQLINKAGTAVGEIAESATTREGLSACKVRFNWSNSGTFSAKNIQIEKGSATTYAPYFTPIELAKIGDYHDRIKKNLTTGKWYIEKQVGKVVLDGSTDEYWYIGQTGTDKFYYQSTNNLIPDTKTDSPYVASNYGVGANVSAGNTTQGIYIVGDKRIRIRYAPELAIADWNAKLSANPMILYYALATPTTTEITNEALIAQLDALGASSLYVGVNNIGTETLNAMPTLKIEYYTEYTLDGAGYEWEPGGNTAKTIVTVAGVDSAWPIWTVQGGAQNPTLTNITTGQTISWQGFVPEGQTLTINMAEMTADLAGANVFEYITGEWLRLAPGNNTLVYNAGNADKPSTLSWNGVLA